MGDEGLGAIVHRLYLRVFESLGGDACNNTKNRHSCGVSKRFCPSGSMIGQRLISQRFKLA